MLNGNIDFVVADEAPAELLVRKLSSNSSFGDKVHSFLKELQKQGGYKLILTGLRNTLLIAVLGLLIGIVLGTLIATAGIVPQYKLLPRILNRICRIYVGFFRGTPIVVQLLLGYYVLLPLLGLNYPPLAVCIVIFGLNSAAYVSEIMRSGIGAVDKGQLEAGRALGLSFATTMMKIVIPQAVKNILPTLGNEFISLIKETSVVSFVSAVDIYKAFNIMATNSYEYIVPYLTMAVIYILLIALITLLVNCMERRLARSDKGIPSK
jgi:polar amino acid transport system permease protein